MQQSPSSVVKRWGFGTAEKIRSRLTGDLGFTMEEREGSLGFRAFISKGFSNASS